mgnify:FL=1
MTDWERVGAQMVPMLCLRRAHDCNLRCRYCYGDTGDFGGKRELMPAPVAPPSHRLSAALEQLFLCEAELFGG